MINKRLVFTVVVFVSMGALVSLSIGSSYELTVDNKTPYMEIKSGTIWLPSDLMCVPGTVSGIQNIVINITGSGYCELYIDGIFISKIYQCKEKNHVSGYYERWDTTKYVNGLHEIKIIGPDEEIVDSVIVYVKNDDAVVPPVQDKKSIVVNPSDDITIHMNAPNATGYGSDKNLTVRNRYGASDHWERDILIRFDLSSIPAGTSVVSAKLYLYYFYYWDNDPAGRSLTAHLITSDWNENTVNWNIAPGYDTVSSASAIVPSSTGRWMSWDVTIDLQKFVNGEKTNFGWQIMDETFWGDCNIPIPYFYSKENGALIPYLEIIT